MDTSDLQTQSCTCGAKGNLLFGVVAVTIASMFLALIIALIVCVAVIARGQTNHSPQPASNVAEATAVTPRPRDALGVATHPKANNRNCEVATLAEASSLLSSLFPNMEIISTTADGPVAGAACLLEVELYADRDHPSTLGVVYVLPNGEGFINGPLMSQDSQISLEISGAAEDLADEGEVELGDSLLSKIPPDFDSQETREWLKSYILQTMLDSSP